MIKCRNAEWNSCWNLCIFSFTIISNMWVEEWKYKLQGKACVVKKIKKDVSDVKNTREGILHRIKSILYPVLLTDNHNILHGKLWSLSSWEILTVRFQDNNAEIKIGSYSKESVHNKNEQVSKPLSIASEEKKN